MDEKGIYQEFPFLASVGEESFFSGEGAEIYAIVYADNNVNFTVSAQSIDYDSGNDMPLITDKVIGTGKGAQPNLIRGNYSDILPELLVTISSETGPLCEYRPSLSLENGKLNQSDGVYDFTPYALLGMSPYYVGEWYCELRYDEDMRLALLLDLYDDGVASFSYGGVSSEIIESLSGTWSEENGNLNLILNGTTKDEQNGTTGIYVLNCIFAPSLDGEVLRLLHVGGDSFFENMQNTEFEFEYRG